MRQRRPRVLLAAFLLCAAAAGAWALRASGLNRRDARRFALNGAQKRQRRAPPASVRRAVSDFATANGGRWRVRFDPRTGALSALSEGLTAPRPGGPRAAAQRFLADTRSLTSIDSSALTLRQEAVSGGISHFLYQQTYKGIPVEFSRVKVHVDEAGRVLGMGSSYEPELSIDVSPSLGEGQAYATVLREGGPAGPFPGELVIFPDEQSGAARLAWKFSVRHDLGLWRYYVDAHTGQLLFRYDDMRRQAPCITSGVVSGMVYDIDPDLTPATVRYFKHNRIYVKDGANFADTDATGFFCAQAKGKIIASLQGPFANVSNFRGPSAHYDNGSGVWSSIATPLSSPHPYGDHNDLVSTIDITASVPAAVKVLPVFSRLQVGSWNADAGDGGDIGDNDLLAVLDSSGNAVGSYVGDLVASFGRNGVFKGAAVHGGKMQLRLRSNAALTNYGYDIGISSYLTLSAPGDWAVDGSSVFWKPEYTAENMRSEISLFYHINAMHDYFMGDVNRSSAAYIGKPVNVRAFLGPTHSGAFYDPEYDNLSFGDLNTTQISDAWTDDATVSRHEYTHYMVEKIWPLLNWGQGGAISEAVADYFAGSSLNTGTIGRHLGRVLDPQNPNPQPFRELDCPTKAPCLVFSGAAWHGEIHDDSPFVSQALWDIRKARIALQGAAPGQSCADGLVFNSLLFFPDSFAELYDAIRRVDSEGIVANCNPGGNAAGAASADITAAFSNHGLPGGVGDAYERNDGFQSATDVSTLSFVNATIFPGADSDFYAFGAGPGKVRATLTLPADGSFYKGYSLTLFDRNHVAVASAEPPYDGFNTFAGFCELEDCTTTASSVTLEFSTDTANYYYLRVAGGTFNGDVINGSPSAVSSASPYRLAVSAEPTKALPAGILTASFDNDVIRFTAAVTSFSSAQNFDFAYARLRDQSLGVVPLTLTPALPGTTSYLTILATAAASGVIRGDIQLNPGFADRFPSLGSVHLELFGYRSYTIHAADGPENSFTVFGSTVSLGLSNRINLSANKTTLTAWNNVFNPLTGQKTTIKYETLQAGRVRLRLFNMSGTLVTTLLDEEVPAGKGSVDWSGKGGNGNPVASGVYLLHLEASGFSKTQKIVVVK